MSLSVQPPLFHGPPSLCQGSYPTLPYLDSFHLAAHMAHIALVGPLPSDELEQVPYPLPPPKWRMGFPMLYHTLGVLSLLDLLSFLSFFAEVVIPGHVAML